MTMSKACPLSGPWFPHLIAIKVDLSSPFNLIFSLGEYLGCRGIVILFQDLPKAHSGVCYSMCVYA